MTIERNGHTFETAARNALSRQVFIDQRPTALIWNYHEKHAPSEEQELSFLERSAEYILANPGVISDPS